MAFSFPKKISHKLGVNPIRRIFSNMNEIVEILKMTMLLKRPYNSLIIRSSQSFSIEKIFCQVI
jgi:hypothetical protein